MSRFFHSFEIDQNTDGAGRREIGWQGVVLEKRLRGTYLIQLFDWLSGEPSDQRLVNVDDMIGWQFYDSAEEMRAFYEDRMFKQHTESPSRRSCAKRSKALLVR